MGKHSAQSASVTQTLPRILIPSAIAASVPLVAVGTAEAAPEPNWAPIIACESGDRNIENPGPSTASGYYQFLDSTWALLGGREFAPRAIQATKAQQTIIANRAFANRTSRGQNGFTDWNASRSCWASRISANPTINQQTTPAPVAPVAVVPRATPRSNTTRAIDCSVFNSADEATRFLAADQSDPHNIDTDNDGIPCETRFGNRGRTSVFNAAPAPQAQAPAPAPQETFTKRDKKKSAANLGSQAVNPASVDTGSSTVAALAKSLASKNIPYVFGGKTPAGFDCSGFVSYVLNQTGQMNGYRNSGALKAWAIPVSAANSRAGDLVFYPGHVAIYLGNGMIADAGNSVSDVSVRKMWSGATFGRPRG